MLDTITLRNFKAFDDLELDLSNITLLSGLNGSGKSTILQALGLIRQSFDSSFLSSGNIALSGSLVDIGTGHDVLYHNFDKPEIQIGIRGREHGEKFNLLWTADVTSEADVLTCKENAEIDYDNLPIVFSDMFQFLRADRITPDVTFPKSQHAIRQQRFLGPRGEYTAHFLMEFADEIRVPNVLRRRRDSGAGSLGAQVNEWLQEFSPGVRVEAVKVPMTDLVRLVYSYRGEGAAYGESLRPTNVGFGLTHVLPVIVASLASVPGALVVVENPEAQIHPRGQTSLGFLLALTASTGVQIIVESHSDHVLNGIRLAVKERALCPNQVKLHFFSRNHGESSTFQTTKVGIDGRLSHWPEAFFDEWEKSLDRLLG